MSVQNKPIERRSSILSELHRTRNTRIFKSEARITLSLIVAFEPFANFLPLPCNKFLRIGGEINSKMREMNKDTTT